MLDGLKRPESRIRYWLRRELRERDAVEVRAALDQWVVGLRKDDARFRHHQLEALWVYRGINQANVSLLRELLSCEDHHARAATVTQLRFLHQDIPDAQALLTQAANDENAIVRMEAAILASYIGTKEAFGSIMEILNYPAEGHLSYAISCALGSHKIRPHWERDDTYNVAKVLRDAKRKTQLREPSASATEAQFDAQTNLATFKIGCLPEVMKFTQEQIAVKTGQPVKIVFSNPDATDHNMVIVKPGALAEVGIAANLMARDPKNANSDFIPKSKRDLILHASKMIGPTRKSKVHVFRFNAPTEPGIYPYVCTFPGHWVVMKGNLVVANDLSEVDAMVAAARPKIIKEWSMADFDGFQTPPPTDAGLTRGMAAFAKANCNQCHVLGGRGISLGPELKDTAKKFKGAKLLKQLIEPSSEINEKYQTYKFLMTDGRVVSGVIAEDSRRSINLMENLLTPKKLTKISKDGIEERFKSKVSAMPTGLLDVLTKQEIADLLTLIENQ